MCVTAFVQGDMRLMTEKGTTILEALRRVSLSAAYDPAGERGWHIMALTEPERIVEAARLLFAEEFSLSFVTAAHVSQGFEIIYQFFRWDDGLRVELRVSVSSGREVPSLSSFYQGAAWHEREICDFFGLGFSGHPGLKPLILTRQEKGLNPLLKQQNSVRPREDLFLG